MNQQPETSQATTTTTTRKCWTVGGLLAVAVLIGILGSSHLTEAEFTQTVLSPKTVESLCADPGVCEAIEPIVDSVVLELAFRAYTNSQNYGLIKVFQTPLPCITVHGVGIGPQLAIWTTTNSEGPVCDRPQ